MHYQAAELVFAVFHLHIQSYEFFHSHNPYKQCNLKCSNLLHGVSIYATDFSFIEPKKGDFVYLDPPYHQSGERFYTRLPFDEKDQIRLRDFVYELTNKGVKIMLSNTNTTFIKDLYKDFFF
ncbi:hypothetical protein F0363_04675 [Orientia tsutsugamushi]|nr:hypothetical protein F0363_04675 [Orientia tsutsugamushi]